ncbi:MAG TPA: DinB family protein [Bryobacteraceae bacterium]|nr:DinB family protein [Bryobacteraceae bacterium]
MRVAVLCSMFALGILHAQNPLTSAITQYFNRVRANLEESADLMPPDKYSFKLSDGQMTFGEWMAHAALSNYAACAPLRGEERPPEVAQYIGRIKDKAELSKVLKGSFTYCQEALQGMDDAKALASQQLTGNMVRIVAHNNEIYGNIVGYLRASGLVPPSTARRKK